MQSFRPGSTGYLLVRDVELSKAWILHIIILTGRNKPFSQILVENYPVGYHLPEALLLGGSEHHFKRHQYVFMGPEKL